MIKSLIAISVIAASLSGCIAVVPVVQPARVEFYQPTVDVVYVWDNSRTSYYYVERGHRMYMPRRWSPEPSYYHRHR